ncbi:MAG: hypothetical protein CYG59_13920 [Chloroflexi bacterium]|nr:MAG: hypothetical protein CYG59_13920 [Chloroflexota bacterium]
MLGRKHYFAAQSLLQSTTMERTLPDVLVLPANDVPPTLSAWLHERGANALLVSVEQMDDGRLVLQSLPDVDPTLVARIRKMLAEHADVLRRLA